MKTTQTLTLFYLLFSCLNLASAACDPRKTGTYSNFFDNTSHGGYFSGYEIQISCKNDSYEGILACPRIVSNDFFSKNLADYFLKARVNIKTYENNVIFIVADEVIQKCGLRNLQGTYRHFNDGDDIYFYNTGCSLDKIENGRFKF